MTEKKTDNPILFVVGTRGFPDVQGGVETHCEQLYPRIAKMGWQIIVSRRKCYLKSDAPQQWKNVKFCDLYAPRAKSIEAITHSISSVFKAKQIGAKLVHIHAIGPWLVAPLARLLGLKVVCTHHGSDYRREKWGKLAKTTLKIGERLGAKFANEVIVISNEIANTLGTLYNRKDTHLIYNGVPEVTPTKNKDYIEELGIESNKYILALGRFVPEKNFHLLIKAFVSANITGYKLVIAGDADHPSPYSEQLKEYAQKEGIVLTGFVKGEKLHQLLSHAGLFVLPSSHEGLPISLLEAMSYGCNLLVSNIKANMLPELKPDDIFELDETGSNLCNAIKRKLTSAIPHKREYNMKNYNWDTIAKQTIEVYKRAIE